MEVESSASGVVRSLLVDEGAVVPVNSPIAIVGTADEEIGEQGIENRGEGAGNGEKQPAISDQSPVTSEQLLNAA